MDIETRGIILSMQRITKTLIRLHDKNRFSYDVAHIPLVTGHYFQSQPKDEELVFTMSGLYSTIRSSPINTKFSRQSEFDVPSGFHHKKVWCLINSQLILKSNREHILKRSP